ncbi:adenosylmethionine--8-amino-7-oxononanoate transaminase [Tahibacter harae]|uniref:Adenosylmethionine-8-amino-7-oxononanoate aminotransferase n=1 Tax=Tahibacter harae TaxID=2963937 RepID=A0ABT1QSB9_9GAMM|nr:adenosylmethionine--8-amino-7-oxononanoate transaminase [Tahibacter harae]MCQ4165198.1 adenosylmethionine--8-amino-7-oxononanoate transaminase [Tahibacter harae]
MSSSLPRSNAALAARDLAVLWHPCTQMHDHETLPLLPIVRAEGVWLYDADGRRYLDAVSSWWTNIFGHRHPRLVAALKEQLDTLDHVMLAGFTHEPALELAEELLRIAPPGLARVFYADNGSAAVEVALKMSFHYWRNQGRGAKQRFIALSGSYHGETLGALSVTDVALYRDTYAPLLLQPVFTPSPDAYAAEPGESAADVAARRLGELRQLLQQHAAQTCAVIVEPLVQCAAGMRMYHPDYLSGLRALCDEFEVHLIADEIAVGFGRTGTLFACEQGGITPDFLCLSKGLTGGMLPLSAVLTTQDVYAAFYAEYRSGKAFLHSHSYTGNALACRAALATLGVFRDEPILQRNRELAAHLARTLEPLRAHPQIADVRQCGLIAAVELVRDRRTREPYPAEERRGLRVYRHGLEHGMLLRPLGNVVYFMPPYVITPEQIDAMVAVAAAGIDRATE